MELEFELTREDYKEFVKHAYSRMARIGKGKMKFFVLNLVAWVLIGIAATGVFRFYEMYDGIDFLHLNLAFLFLGFSVVWLIVITVYQQKFYLRYALDEHGHLLKPQVASITEETIDISTNVSNQTYAWSAIQGSEYSDNLAYLFIDNGQALIFPKRAFESDSQMEAYVALVDSKLSAGNQVE